MRYIRGIWNPGQRFKWKQIWKRISCCLRTFVWLLNAFTLFNTQKPHDFYQDKTSKISFRRKAMSLKCSALRCNLNTAPVSTCRKQSSRQTLNSNGFHRNEVWERRHVNIARITSHRFCLPKQCSDMMDVLPTPSVILVATFKDHVLNLKCRNSYIVGTNK